MLGCIITNDGTRDINTLVFTNTQFKSYHQTCHKTRKSFLGQIISPTCNKIRKSSSGQIISGERHSFAPFCLSQRCKTRKSSAIKLSFACFSVWNSGGSDEFASHPVSNALVKPSSNQKKWTKKQCVARWKDALYLCFISCSEKDNALHMLWC